MTASIPLHARIQFNTDAVLDEPVLLLQITDSTLTTPLYFCSYPVSRISLDPVLYGMVSNGLTYQYCITGSIPSDQDGTPLTTTIVLDNVTQEFTALLRKLTTYNVCTLTLVLASDPDTTIRAFTALSITQTAPSTDSISLTMSRNRNLLGESSTLEPWPSGRQTRNQAPGLHK